MTGSLSTAILASISGQKVAQAAVATTAHNLQNVDTEGYSRKEQLYTTQVLNGIGCGVSVGEVIRVTDMIRVEQLREMTSESNLYEVLTTFYDDLSKRLGEPGENNSLCSSLAGLKASLNTLVQKPESEGAQANLLQAAKDLSRDLQSLSSVAQGLRADADAQIASYVQDANAILKTLRSVNIELMAHSGVGQSKTEFMDLRDQNLKKLSELMNLRVQYSPDGQVSIFTADGTPLLQEQAGEILFSPTSGMNAGASYGAGTVNGVLVKGAPNLDVTPFIQGGRIGGLLAIRDTEMPAFQDALDQMAGSLRDEINAIHNRGTASQVPQSLTGTRAGLGAADNIVGAGTVKIAVVDRATGTLVEERVLDLSVLATQGDILAQINMMVNGTASFNADGVLTLQATNPAYGIAVASTSPAEATLSGLGFSHFYGLNDFFVTGNTLTGTAPGVASQFQVRPSIASNARLIAHTKLDVLSPVGARVVASGGNGTIMEMTQVFSASLNYNAAGKVPALMCSVEDYAATIIHFTAAEARHVSDQQQKTATVAALKMQGLESIRGVNMQEEMMSLMKWERHQKICTQLRLTAENMLNDLMRINR